MRQNALFGACSEWCLFVCGTAIAVPDLPLGGHLAMSGQYASTIGAQRLLYDLLVSRRLGADAKKAERDRIVTWNLGVSLYPSVGGCAMQSQGQSYE